MTSRTWATTTFSLSLSLVAIVVYWIYQILSRESAQVLPASFPELVFRIARTKIIVLAAVLALLWLRGEDWRALGLGRREWPKHLGIGLLFGVAMFVAFNVVLSTLMRAILPAAHTSGPSILSFFKDAGNLLVWIPIGILGGGFVEEIQRIFILTRFEQALGRLGLVLAVAASSVMFGFGHLYQGLSGAISTGVAGLVLSLIYLRRRSALEPIVAHAFSDVLAVLAASMLAR
jgi:membrane protease YdiL (CAAX protease family)